MLKNCKEHHNFSNLSLSYEIYGEGPSIILCFHGFGEQGSKFAYLAHEYGERYTIYSFDFLYHGDSSVINSDHSLSFDKNVFTAYFQDFMVKKNLGKVNLIGFSMGGRMCLSLIEKMPENINSAILLAPDGINDSFWFNFSTQTVIGKRIFKHFTYHPRVYKGIIKGLLTMGLISPKIDRMIKINTASPAKRQQVFNTWAALAELKTDPRIVEKILNEFDINFNIIVGKYDKIIPPRRLKTWPWIAKNIDKLHVVNQGHLISDTVIINNINDLRLL